MGNPKVFISYAWTDESRDWVRQLATRLTADGVQVLLDQWDVKGGQEVNQYMEKAVADPTVTHVLIICDKRYTKKADERAGGVGTETQIISPEVYASASQTKFLPVLWIPGDDSTPAYLRSRVHFDLADPRFESEYKSLLRHLFNKPRHKRPKLGTPPSFLDTEDDDADGQVRLNTRDLIRAIKMDSPRAGQQFDQLITTLLMALATRYPADLVEISDDTTYELFTSTIGLRSALLQATKELPPATSDSDPFVRSIHRVFEGLLRLADGPHAPGVQGFRSWALDHFAMIARDWFIHVSAELIQGGDWKRLSILTSEPYFYRDRFGRMTSVHYTRFSRPIEAVDAIRNGRLRLNKRSLNTHYTIEHSPNEIEALITADCVLYVRSAGFRRDPWRPYFAFYGREVKPLQFFYRGAHSQLARPQVAKMVGAPHANELGATLRQAAVAANSVLSGTHFSLTEELMDLMSVADYQ